MRPALIALLLICVSAVPQEMGTSAESQATVTAVNPSETSVNGGTASTSAKPTSPTLDLTPDANRSLSQAQMQQLFRVVADKDLENNKRLRDYTYIEREVDDELDGKGNIKSREVHTSEVLEIYGGQVERLIEKDDKPLSQKEAAEEEERIQKIIHKRKNESEKDRKKREEHEEKDREQGRKFVTEVSDAYNFKLVGTELLGGREAWVIDAEPRPGFVPHMKEAKMLSKFHGRVWIDKADLQLAKLEAECLDTVSFGLFVARLHKGSRVMLEQTRVNDEVWLPQHSMAKIDIRLALVKGFNMRGEATFRDYKKFRTSSRIAEWGEVEEKK